MEKSIKDGKLWNYRLLQYRVTPIAGNLPLTLEALTGCKLRTSLPQTPSSAGKSVETSRIRKELIKHQPSTSTNSPMELKPGQPVFANEVHGNDWKTGTIDQPAKEPESYLVEFPDNSILRRTRSIIKPDLNLPISSWKLKAENGTTEDTFHHILTIPSTQISKHWRSQLCQWTIWFHQL